MMRSVLIIAIFLSLGRTALAQATALDSAMQQLAAENDPAKAVAGMNNIIAKFKINKSKDSETLDVLYGTVAVSFAMKRNYPQFEKYVGMIRNKFNKTSFMNMTASKMLEKEVDAAFANKVAIRTLALYHSFKEDTTARPADFSKENWQRFMHFAQYPYYDTYAQSLFVLKKYDKALQYQEKAFDGDAAEGLPSSIERYAKLLHRTGNIKAAKELLLRVARLGRLNRNMMEQLQAIHIAEKGSDKDLDVYIDSLQKIIQVEIVAGLKEKMLNETAPFFTLKDINGKAVKLTDYTGRIVVLDLWATWCSPCIASFPAMQSMVEKHPKVAFLFIAVEENEPGALQRVKTFVEKRKYPFTVLMDEPLESNLSQYKITSTYRPDGIPAKYIIDKKGMLRFRTSGFDTDQALINELEAMFMIVDAL